MSNPGFGMDSTGASGSEGSVEEPCATEGIFPTANFHTYYAQGKSLGESYLRSVQYVATHDLLYGDPLTRPFAYIPTVTVSNPPTGVQAGTITITPGGSSLNPAATIVSFDLLVDGVKVSSAAFGQSLSLDTTTLSDGRHDLRVLGYDNTPVRNVGRWTSTLDTMNFGRTASLTTPRRTGLLPEAFTFQYSASGGTVSEVRLIQNGRVLAASAVASGTLTVYGQNMGAWLSNVHIEALYTDGRLVESVPLSVDVVSRGTPAGVAPVAFNYSRNLQPSVASLVELPASYDAVPNTATYTLLNSPTQATILDSGTLSTGPYRIIQPNPGATGSEQLQFQATTPAGTSNVGTITLNY